MKKFAGSAVMLALASSAAADIVSWNAASGVLPSDGTLPAAERYVLGGQAPFAALSGSGVAIDDDSTSLRVGFSKADITPIDDTDDWAFQTSVRVDALARANFEFGPTMGIDDESKRIRLALTDQAVGFVRDDGLGFVDGLSHTLDTTDGFHTYRVIQSGSDVSLFVDSFASAVLTLPVSSFGSSSGTKIWLTDSSNTGTAQYEISAFAYNPNGTNVPEPSSVMLVCFIGAVGLLRKN